MKKSFAILLLALACSLQAQETFTYANPDRQFFEGKELFVQKKYAASVSAFEEFLQQRATKADPDRVQEAVYYLASGAYELRKSSAQDLLEAYLKRYPYTQFEPRVCLLLGNLAFEQKQYNLALSWYDRTNESRLTKEDNHELLFNKGYAFVQTEEYDKAKPVFAKLKAQKTKYSIAASYYYAYSEYSLKNYDAALTGFLAIENQPEYSGFVPYYIIQIYYHKKNYEELVPYAEKTLQANPQNPNNTEVYRILGGLAYENNDYQKAIDWLNRYVKSSSKVVRNDMYILGMSYYKTNDFKNAITYLAKATTAEDSLAQNAYLHLGNSYVQTGNVNNARMSFRSAAAMDFDPIIKEEAAYNYALATCETTTPFGEAIKAFETFLADYPASKYRNSVYEKLVTIYITSRDYHAAAASIDKLKSLSPEMKDAKAYISFQLGTEEFVRGNYEKAISLFDSSLKEATANFKAAQVYYWRGETYYRLENYEKAASDYTAFFTQKGATEFADYNLANYALGYACFQQKKYTEARPHFLKYVENEQNTTRTSYLDALDRLGDSYFAARDLANAEKYYSLSVEKGAKNADYALFQKAFVQGLQKNYQGKIAGLQSLLKNYPRSEYRDDACYEMARAYVLLNQQQKAIETYQTLREQFPQSPLSRKAAVETAMLHYNAGEYDAAITAYKRVVADYPGSEETRTALETMEDIYVEKNAVADYFAYTRTLDESIVKPNPSKEDSLTYRAAENLYMKGNMPAATAALAGYVTQFCPSGTSCVQARYFLADSYLSAQKINEAYEQYEALAALDGNPYMETVLLRVGQIAYDKQDYPTALDAYKRLLAVAQETENIDAAKIGVLRSSYSTGDAETTVSMATDVCSSKNLNKELEREARFYRAKSYIRLSEPDKAQADLKLLAQDLRTAAGAEAKFLVAAYYFDTGDDKKAEAEVNEFIAKGTSHQHWLARAFVLLADIYIKRGDDFEAKQYLLSLQANYKGDDSITEMLNLRLQAIEERERERIIL